MLNKNIALLGTMHTNSGIRLAHKIHQSLAIGVAIRQHLSTGEIYDMQS